MTEDHPFQPPPDDPDRPRWWRVGGEMLLAFIRYMFYATAVAVVICLALFALCTGIVLLS